MLTFGYDVEATGSNPFENKLITIQYRRNNQNTIFKIWDHDNSERELILDFLNDWKTIPTHISQGGDYFVTYNLRLDAPFLLTRCLLNNISSDVESGKHLWNTIIHAPSFIDLYQLLGDKSTRFDYWREKFGLPSSRFSNFDVPHMYRKGEFASIEEYVNDELVALEKVYEALRKESFFVELEKLKASENLGEAKRAAQL